MKPVVMNSPSRRMIRLVPFLLLALALMGSSFGCGYTRKTVLPQEIKTIYVDTVKNEIKLENLFAYQPGLEIDITNAIIRRLQRDGILQVTTRDHADAILDSRLIGYEQEGLRFSGLESIEEYRLFIVLDMQLINNKTKEVLWKEPNFSGDAEYFVSSVRSLAREEATHRAIDRLARNVVDRIVEDW